MSDNPGRSTWQRPPLPDMDDSQYAAWFRLLASRFGVVLAMEHKSLFLSGLRTRMREIGCDDYGDYYDLLSRGHSSAPEWAQLIDRLTIHETRFFRDQQAVKLLREKLLPGYLARPRAGGFQAWSLGCATGEEAYTLAMVLDAELGGESPDHRYAVTGTDISMPALEVARGAVYTSRRWSSIPEQLRERYCHWEQDGRFRIDARLSERVCFSKLNLFELDAFPLDGFDLLYCQNVLIYFERSDRHAILDRMAAKLAPGGVMIIGPGDVLSWTHPEMQRIKFEGTLAYRRRGEPEEMD